MSAINDIHQLRVVCYSTSQIAINVVHLRTTAVSGTGATPQQIATLYDGAIAAAYKGWIANTVVYRGVGVKTLKPTPTLEFASVANAGNGAGVTVMMPGQVCGLLHLGTPTPGKTGRGRIYLPFPPTTFMSGTGDSPTAAANTAAAAIATPLFSSGIIVGGGGNTITLNPTIWHRTLSTWTDITSAVFQPKWATQRRRGDYGRPNTVLPF